jgi:salicylate hydroxylase
MCDVAVVGGGIGGLTLAASLSQKSVSVQIFEQDTELREIGAGIAIGGNATRLLQDLGIDLAQAANMPPALVFRCWRDGGLLWSHPIGEWYRQEVGAPFLTLHRATLQHLLAAAVPPDCIQLGHRGHHVAMLSLQRAGRCEATLTGAVHQPHRPSPSEAWFR